MSSSSPTPPPPDDGDAPADYGWHLGVLVRAYQSSVTAALEDVPHRLRGYWTLREVARGTQPTQLALATHLGIDKTVMTYLIDDLAKEGLVDRRPLPSDRRVRKIVATAEGELLLAAVARRVHTAEESVLGALDSRECAAFRTLLRKVACTAQAVDQEVDPCRSADAFTGEDPPADTTQ
jgi:MarR family transcriptional regulator, transcriptional regulator for hemolysin